VLPSDGEDRGLDTNGVMAGSVTSLQRWLAEQTGGRSLLVDMFSGQLDVSFLRLPVSDAQLAQTGDAQRGEIERYAADAGLIRPGKHYVAYYDGSRTTSCGEAAWPPAQTQLAALYLRGQQGDFRCASRELAGAQEAPGFWEFATLHEVLHNPGFAADCATHSVGRGHVGDSPTDIMYAGSEWWEPSALDVGHDDYYAHSIPGCPDFQDSAYLSSSPWPLPAGNMTRNPSFETDLTGWGSFQGKLSRLARPDSLHGSYLVQAERSGGTSFSVTDNAGTATPTVPSTTAGATYIATAQVRSAAASSSGNP